MTKTLKKGTSLLVVLMMLMSMAPGLVFASETEATETTLVYTLDAHQYTLCEGQSLNETGEGGPEVGFRKEVESGKNIISYIQSGLKLTYSVNFESEVTNMDVLLAYAKSEYAGGFTMTVEVDGSKIGTTTTFGHKGTNFSGYSTHDVAMSSPISAGEHTISITFGASVNFYGIEFYNCPQIDAFEPVDPTAYSYYQKGTLVPTGTNDASRGFEQSEDAYGKNISYVKSGLTFVYKNVYFEEAPYDFTINLGTSDNTSEKVKVYIDGALLETLNTTASGKSYIPSPYTARVSGIEAGSTHEIAVVIQQDGGVNFYGFQFASNEQKNGLGFINAQTWDATSGKLNTGTSDANLGFTHENDAYGVPMVSYIANGTKFEYKNLYFEEAAYDMEIKLCSMSDNKVSKAKVYIDGVLLANLDTTAAGIIYNEPSSYGVVLSDGLIQAGSIHDVTVEILDRSVNFSGFGFYAKREGFDFVNPQSWDNTNKALAPSGTNNSSVGFEHENDYFGNPMVSYIPVGTKLEYHNLYFAKAPETLTLYVITGFKDQIINVTLADGTALGSITTTGGDWVTPAPYQIDVTGKIAAGTICDVVLSTPTAGFNYCGMQFLAGETIKYDADTNIVTLNTTPDMAGKVAFIASYTTGERMVNVMKETVTYTEGTPQTIGVSEIITGADIIKVFIWEDESELVPVIDCEDFDI